MRQLQYLWVLLLVVGCATIGLTVAKNFDERLAYALTSHTAVQKATAKNLNDRLISSADADAILKMADDSRPFLDGARSASQLGDMDTANARLILATTSLTALQTYLNSRSKK